MPLDIGRLRAALPGRRIEYFPAVDSTMTAAARLERGTIVVADEQTAGQGRHGHQWHSEPGNGIYYSAVLEPTPVLTLALGLAAQEALRQAVGLECDIRWPNDLMASNRKLGGILTQLERANAVTGIGINVNHLAFPPEIGDATSVRLELGQDAPVSREAIILALAPAIDLFTKMEQSEILRLFSQASSYATGRRVTVQMADGVIEGVTDGLDAAGFLKVRKDDGTTTLVLAGGVRATGA